MTAGQTPPADEDHVIQLLNGPCGETAFSTVAAKVRKEHVVFGHLIH